MFNANRRQPLPRLDPRRRRQQLEYNPQGVIADITPGQLPPEFYSRVINMEPADIGMKSSLGHIEVFPGYLFPPEHLAFATAPGLFYWLYFAGAGAGVTDGQGHFDISPAIPFTTLYPAVNWTTTNINDFPVINNGADAPLYWNLDIGSPLEPLPNWPVDTYAQSIRAFTKALIAMNISDGSGDFKNFLMWSNSAEPGTVPTEWAPLPENDAGFNTLSDTRGDLLDGQAFRDNMLLFKQHSTYIMTYIGGNFVYAFRKLFETTGILASNCSDEFRGNVIMLTDGDVVVSDGQQAETIIDKQNRDWLFRQIDTDNYQNSFLTAYHSESQVWICFPENGEVEPNLALVWDSVSAKWGVRELYPVSPHIARGQVGSVSGVISWDDDPESWDSDVEVWNQSLFNPTEDALLQADRIGSTCYAVNEGIDWNGEPEEHYLERIGLDFGDILRKKYVYGLILRITGSPGTEFEVRVGSTEDDGSAVNWGPIETFVLGDNSQGINAQVSGRLIAFSVRSVGTEQQWFLQGVEFLFDWRGRY